MEPQLSSASGSLIQTKSCVYLRCIQCRLVDSGCTEDENNLRREIRTPQLKGRGLVLSHEIPQETSLSEEISSPKVPQCQSKSLVLQFRTLRRSLCVRPLAPLDAIFLELSTSRRARDESGSITLPDQSCQSELSLAPP